MISKEQLVKFAIVLAILVTPVLSFAVENTRVKQGDKALDFSLKTINGEKVNLKKLNDKNAVVLIVLRGWPEYQCGICSRQVGQFIFEAEKFQELGTKVLMVYPGPSSVLQEKANEFSEDFKFPDNFSFALDPNYSMVNKYGLRWDAPRETAYPSTFVIDKNGVIVYSKISETHGGRAKVDEVMEVLGKL